MGEAVASGDRRAGGGISPICFHAQAISRRASVSARGTDLTEERPRRRRRPSPRAAEIIDFLEYLPPPSLGSPDQTYGLQIGSPGTEIRSMVVAPMATFNALSTAASRKQSLLITAAPLITEPLTSIRRDSPIGGKVAYLTEHRINLYA